MKKLLVLCLAVAVLFAFVPIALDAYHGDGGGKKWEGKGDWKKKWDECDDATKKEWKQRARWWRVMNPRPLKILGLLLGLALMVVITSALLVLVRATSAGYVAKLGKSISKNTVRNLIIGLVVSVAWLTIAHYTKGNDTVGLVLVVIAGLLGIGVVYAGAAMSEIVGGKTLALMGSKKVTSVRSIVAGMTVLTLAVCAVCPVVWYGPGTLVLIAVLAIELGAVLSVLVKK